jgi:histone-lysine N-methyltransferase SETD3
MYERALLGAAPRPGAAWRRSYVALLPGSTGGVLEWPEEDVALLQGSHLHTLALEIRAAAAASWLELAPAVRELERAAALPAGALGGEGAARWAFGVLLSRLVRLPGLADAEALVPLADFANHDPESTAFFDWDPASEAVVLQVRPAGHPCAAWATRQRPSLTAQPRPRLAGPNAQRLPRDKAPAAYSRALQADRAYRSGQQVFISYGQKTSGELLLSYGFAPPPGANPHDACLLPGSLDPADSAAEWKERALAVRGLPPGGGALPLRMGAVPRQALALAAFAAASAGSPQEVEKLADSLLGPASDGRAAGAAGGAAAGADLDGALLLLGTERLASWCKDALAAWPRPLEQDQSELQRLEQSLRAAGAEPGSSAGASRAPGSSSRGDGAPPAGGLGAERDRRRLEVLRVVVRDRQVLARAAFLLQQSLRELRRAGRGR